MSCPTCDHTMERIGQDGMFRVAICPRCGTVKTETYVGSVPQPDSWDIKVYVPKLVERLRKWIECAASGRPTVASLIRDWQKLGIAESIHKPEDRK